MRAGGVEERRIAYGSGSERSRKKSFSALECSLTLMTSMLGFQSPSSSSKLFLSVNSKILTSLGANLGERWPTLSDSSYSAAVSLIWSPRRWCSRISAKVRTSGSSSMMLCGREEGESASEFALGVDGEDKKKANRERTSSAKSLDQRGELVTVTLKGEEIAILLLLLLRLKSLRGAFLSEEAKDLKLRAGMLLGVGVRAV